MNSARSTAFSLLRAAIVACAIGVVGASWAHAEDYSAITTLLKQKKPEQALTAVDKRIETTPRDPQLLFLRGVAQTDLGKTSEAIETFTNLTQLYPELPEPYNNLAVLHAKQNELEKARRALEMAVRGNPNYAVAYENLGDIYARLAAESYDKAQRLDGRMTPSVAPKLTLLRQLFDGRANTGKK
ncbi:tetratricopeptide repeat protein [Diaphorobacter caeni]|uniref:tetratricopeptide repeat protein n=1 Tax=Diaphorobacter caeni TaxID=2784387 RepID=UPI00188ECCED|nr:tetratricopeptide repeat protein [Diaphorobacter caeni]MBF5005718.1 tetratricopeptide repeat protein [Diaphorobacter caeni]